MSAAQSYQPPPPPDQPDWDPAEHQARIADIGSTTFWVRFFVLTALAVAVGVVVGLYVFVHLFESAVTS